MSRNARLSLFAVSAGVLGALLVWSFTGLPSFGRFDAAYSRLLSSAAVPERHTTNVVAAVTFDYRGLDTFGEELILFASAVGGALLLRGGRGGHHGEQPLGPSEPLRVLAASVSAFLVLLGLWVVAHGYLTPGGGFQGGVVLAAAPVMAYLGSDFRTFRRASPTLLADAAEGAAIAAFAVVGLLGLVEGTAFLENVLPLGTSGELLSSGSIAVLSWATAVEVAAALTLLFTEFLEELETAS